MNLYHAWVSCGRFIVRANTEAEAIALAREEAKEYSARPEDALTDDAGAELLSLDGEPAVLDTDYS